MTRQQVNTWTPSIAKKPKIKKGQFCFAGICQSIHDNDIWFNYQPGMLWLYQLHYFDDLSVSIDSDEPLDYLITRWIDLCPYEGKSPGWQPYPLSLRVVNWIKWFIVTENTHSLKLASLGRQGNVLEKRLEYHLMANHLWVNAKALFFIGLFLEGSKAERWRRKGERLIHQQIQEQMLPDGGHFERSPMYHASLLEDLLDLINISWVYEADERQQWRQLAQSMLRWLNHLTHPDDAPVFFNDTTQGLAPSHDALKAYALRLGISPLKEHNQTLSWFSDSGYAHVNQAAFDAYIDMAPLGPDYQPGHGHADTLCFELSIHNQRVLVNQGIASYDDPRRFEQRSTSAHNTVSVDQTNSSHVWSRFRVAERAKPYNIEIRHGEPVELAASHDGYIKQGVAVCHRRRWRFVQDELTIIDTLKGQGEHTVECFFHFHPELDLIKKDGNSFEITKKSNVLATICLDQKLHVKLERFLFFNDFDKPQEAWRLVGYLNDHLPHHLKHNIRYHECTFSDR